MKSLKHISNKIFMVVLALEFLGCFLFQSVNEVAARFTSLLSFFALVIVVFCYKNPLELIGLKGMFIKRESASKAQVLNEIKEQKSENNQETERNHITEKKQESSFMNYISSNFELFIVAIFSAVALANLFIIGSNKGAFLTACDVLLAMYVAGFLELSEMEKNVVYSFGALLLIWWYGTVRWYFNFNMVGMIFMITCCLTLLLLDSLKVKYKLSYLTLVQVILYVTATLLCLLYHARCVLCGMIILGILLIGFPIIRRSKILRALLIFASTVGSLLFTLGYILLSKTGFSLKILYKDILSGRQDIWGELWEAFAKMPLTGIGSSYHLKSFFIFEVHNGLFDILAVHGIIVFAGVLFMLCKRLWMSENNNRIAFAAIYAILFTSFFENFFINSPYLLVLVVLMTTNACSKENI